MCPRCNGRLFTESVIDYSEDRHGSWPCSHCISCGYYTDPVMEKNRTLALAGTISGRDLKRLQPITLDVEE